MQRLRRRGHILAAWLLPVVVAPTLMFGQSTVPSGTSVRITLTDQRILEGRLMRADSTDLTVAARFTEVALGELIFSIHASSRSLGAYHESQPSRPMSSAGDLE